MLSLRNNTKRSEASETINRKVMIKRDAKIQQSVFLPTENSVEEESNLFLLSRNK